MAVATNLAVRFGSHLVGLHVRAPFQPPAYFDGSFVMDELFKIYEDTTASDQKAALEAFTAATQGRGIVVESQTLDGAVDRVVARRARCADLTVLGQASPEMPGSTPPDLPEVVALSSGRPTLVVPYVEIRQPIGENVLLCWNSSRESARAASDALPVLKTAKKVTVLAFRSGQEEDDETDVKAACEWLGRHGVKAAPSDEAAGDVDIGDLVLSRAADLDADLIVMGVYGHTRVREMVLGGVSRTLLRSMTVPVLMAH
ncbi:universal stress protein [Enhydrobacter aerosaccus]|uniref:universal stress protein n=1 Tax=Enhydrobacter aerosaccus TaxID=225324 RepID=UPI001482C26F|nr:universal stress protein [Enhydrobacter aerosaccus]